MLQVSVDVTEIAFFSDKTNRGEKRFYNLGKEAVFFDLGERNPLEADLLIVMLSSHTEALVALKRAMKDAFNLVEIGVASAKGVVFTDIFTDIGKFADFNGDADFLLSFSGKGLMEGFAVLLATTGKDIENAGSVAHFYGEKFAIFNDDGTRGGSYMRHRLRNKLKWQRHKTQAFETSGGKIQSCIFVSLLRCPVGLVT